MELILNFLVDNYLWFLIISLILVFGLIGYIVDANEKKTPKLHFGNEEDLKTEVPDEQKTLKELLDENSLSEEAEVPKIIETSAEDNISVNNSIDNNQEINQNELPKE